MKRQFITKTDIDRLVEEGHTALDVDATTTVTDLAREHAMRRGVSIRRTGAVEAPPTPSQGAPENGPALPQLRGAVRSAVIARLGEVPPGLDEVLDRVLGE